MGRDSAQRKRKSCSESRRGNFKLLYKRKCSSSRGLRRKRKKLGSELWKRRRKWPRSKLSRKNFLNWKERKMRQQRKRKRVKRKRNPKRMKQRQLIPAPS